ncbi:MAG TPA: PIG-L family deacetylase [Pelagibacterium sp.]|uniref:PIG-L family deacetylase n=1 Tax=Pelagibacterium sp. TaxID=1967288 RepID=UPI002D078838|nr:PIG-L family deacetylase [Pelagibacterium sp.]HWJ86439.1 PIG-L family deacetylase [Pelagibacterium sp.]
MNKISRRMFIASLPAAYAATHIPAWAAPLSDLDLIAQQRQEPALVTLYRRLERLTSTLTIMTTGAHPDDEPSGMLAALRHVYGIHPVLYCITRGEGGQNSIGPERGSVLGVLRTREMQEASRSLDAALAFGSFGHEDSVHDFGFSKDPDATIDRWGREKVVERMTWAFRAYKPDIIMNCFLDVPGQHGHHRAANVATFVSAELSGDSSQYADQLASGLDTWDVPKIYLPAYGGGGGVYDDEVPPPPVTLVVKAPERDAISGATFPQMGEWSRRCHLTQGMGRWRPEPQTEWELNLARVAGGGQAGQAEDDIREGLIATVGHIAELGGMPSDAAEALREAQGLIDEAIADYGDPVVVLDKIGKVGEAIDMARANLPEELRAQVAHRLDRKVMEIDQVLAAAAGVQIRAYTEGGDVTPGDEIVIKTLVDGPDAVAVEGVEIIARDGLTASEDTVSVSADAAYTNPLMEQFDPLGGNGDAFVRVSLAIGGRTAVVDVDLEDALRVLPKASLSLEPDAIVFNTTEALEPVELTATVTGAELTDLDMTAPEGWDIAETDRASEQSGTYALTPPDDLEQSRFNLEPSLLGETAYQINTFTYPHIGRSVVPTTVSVPVQAVGAKLPDERRVGYVSGGNDNVGLWMRRLGLDVVELTPEAMETGAFRNLKTIVVGIFAFGRRPDLQASLGRLHDWVREGGHLVTLYHRPSDGWNPETVPPAFLQIGSPSIRYRVTDANSDVTILEPDHPLLNYPNVIGPDDWANWDKERGLYFASEWGSDYKPLLAMSDPGEDPLEGSLLSAEIGEGRHTHTSLVLHHQLDKLTPGAFRLLANLVQPAR